MYQMLIDSHVVYIHIFMLMDLMNYQILSRQVAFVKLLVDDTCFHLIGQFIVFIHLKIHVASYEQFYNFDTMSKHGIHDLSFLTRLVVYAIFN
jgi:hypothetical protein